MRTLDALVAERVMGARVVYKAISSPVFGSITFQPHAIWNDGGADTDTLLPRYSTDIAAAFEAESKMGETEDKRRSYTFALCELLDVEDATAYYDATDWMTFDAYWMMIHATAEQRCIAMLIAVGVAQDEIDAAMKQEVNV